MNRVKALVLAEACNPRWTSVPLVGWSHYAALARVADVHLVTQVRNRADILDAGLVEGRDFTAIDSEKVAGKTEKLANVLAGKSGKGWTTRMSLMLFRQGYFEKILWEQFGDRIARRQWDVVHQLTPLSPTVPSKMARWCAEAGVPFVWGPLNGGLPWPKGYTKQMTQEREWLSPLRKLHTLLPGYRSTRQSAAAILIGSRATWDQMPARYREKCFYLPENGIESDRFTARRSRVASLPIRCVFLGRLVPYKGCMLLLDAIEPLLRSGQMMLQIVGAGPMEAELKSRVSDRALPGVEFTGQVDHTQVQHVLAGADLLTFPSIREFGGAVALEAMAVGCVPVVANYGGLGELVTRETGFLVEMAPPAQFVQNLRAMLESIARDPSSIDAKSLAGIERAHTQFTWDAKAQRTLAVWKYLVRGTARPQFDELR
jgi:glycosyltransferase involved in cell wall biosynthesis